MKTAVTLFTLTFIFSAMNLNAQPTEKMVAQKVDSIMEGMTLTDKIGEMTQLSIDMISEGEPYNLAEPHRLDEEKLRTVLLDYRVGSILNVGGHAYSLDRWHEIIQQIQDIAINEKPTGIPVLYGIDTIHGANYTLESTLFPQQIAMAATWNPDLVREGARIAAYETRASWIPWNFSPVLDIGRDPRWPRFWETFGEDVHLTEQMGKAMVKGYQGEDAGDPHRVAATLKHFLGYSLPITGKDRTQAWIPERQLREYVLPPFETAMEAGALTVMINSGEINGVPVHASKQILTGLLRDELGFKGIAVSDWQDIDYLYTRHMVAKNYKEAIKMAVNAGLDMAMVPMDLEYPVLLKELVEQGDVPMSRINESVRRILRVKVILGLFEQPYHTEKDLYDKFGSDEFAAASYRSAAEAVTLLKNSDGILPLSKNTDILVAGPAAHSLTYLNGGWTRTWQGTDPQYNTPGKSTILDALKNEGGDTRITYFEGTTFDEDVNTDETVRAAGNADVAVLCIGESPYTEKPGDLNSLALPEVQRTLVKRIAETGTPVILVLVEGRPRVINEIVPLADGVVMAYLPGDEGGPAIADILYGNINPSGKLPFTYPKYVNDLVPYDHNYTDRVDPNFGREGFHPQWEFGHGLSYTTFEYSNLQIDRETLEPGQTLSISVDLANTGKKAGKEVVQLYISDLVASITPPVKRLRGFKKLSIEPGNKKTVTFVISPEDLAFVGKNNTWTTEPGEFVIRIGGLEKKFTYVE